MSNTEKLLQTQLSPYLIVKNAQLAINFYKELFGAKELFRLEDKGIINHVELMINNSIIMLADEMPEWGMRASLDPVCNPISIGIFVDDVDAITEKAKHLGAIIEEPPKTQFYGIRMSSIIDPFNIRWGISTRVEYVPDDEVLRRHKEMVDKMSQSGGLNDEFKEKYYKYKTKYLLLKNKIY